MGFWSCEGVCSEWAVVVFRTLAIWLLFAFSFFHQKYNHISAFLVNLIPSGRMRGEGPAFVN